MEKIILCNACSDDNRARISAYLLNHKQEEVKSGLKIKEEEIKKSGSQDQAIIYVLPNDIEIQMKQEEEIRYAANSVVLLNDHALTHSIQGKLPRVERFNGSAMFMDKEVVVVTPLFAYQLWEKANDLPVTCFCSIHQNGQLKVIEMEVGSMIFEVLQREGISFEDVKGILVGGITGQFISEEQLKSYKVTNDSFFDSIVLFDHSSCMVTETKQLYEQIQETSCGKCVLCREGSTQFMTILNEMTQGKAKSTDIPLLKDVAPLVKAGSYCEFGQKMPSLLLSALELFSDEFEAHITKKTCEAGICNAFNSYCILPENCTGCEACIDECEEEAIIGKKGFIHMIDEDMCTKCGKCLTFCDLNAIIMVSGRKPKLPKKLTKAGRFK